MRLFIAKIVRSAIGEAAKIRYFISLNDIIRRSLGSVLDEGTAVPHSSRGIMQPPPPLDDALR
jgi:hypothetical protein